ncbi:MAG: hypothetical protein KAR21_11640, partial [Spirochaetales bacterium]|nr:hypothetical protein [Spirochaetales bacterium]
LNLAEKYLRQTVFIDLQDLNGNVCDGVHTASMAGSWMSVIYGFAGMRDAGDSLCFSPRLPTGLNEISFKINYSACILSVVISSGKVVYKLLEGRKLKFFNYYDEIQLLSEESMTISLLPEVRVVLIDLQLGNITEDLSAELDAAGIECISMSERAVTLPPPDTSLFMDFAENHRVKRWDCIGITTTSDGVEALKSAELAYLRVEKMEDLTFDSIIKMHKEFSLNWNRGINYPSP